MPGGGGVVGTRHSERETWISETMTLSGPNTILTALQVQSRVNPDWHRGRWTGCEPTSLTVVLVCTPFTSSFVILVIFFHTAPLPHPLPCPHPHVIAYTLLLIADIIILGGKIHLKQMELITFWFYKVIPVAIRHPLKDTTGLQYRTTTNYWITKTVSQFRGYLLQRLHLKTDCKSQRIRCAAVTVRNFNSVLQCDSVMGGTQVTQMGNLP